MNPTEISNRKLTIAALGDLITQAVEVPEEQRWPHLLEVALNRGIATRSTPGSIQVVNHGIGGNTSREGLARMGDVLSCGPDFVLVEFGGNDTTEEPERYVPLDEFTANLDAIKTQIEQAGAAMILITFPPVVNDWSPHNNTPHHQKHGGGDRHVELYRQRTRAFAAENQLMLVDIDAALREAVKANGWEKYFQPDGVHLTQSGNEIICETVLQKLLQSDDFQAGLHAP